MTDLTKNLEKAREQYHAAMAAAADHVLELLAEQQLLDLVRWRLNGGSTAPASTPATSLKVEHIKDPAFGRNVATLVHATPKAKGRANTCTWPGCSRPTKTAGLCGMHYQRRKRGAEMDGPSQRGRPRPRTSKPAALSPTPAKPTEEAPPAPAGKLDNPKPVTRAMLVRGAVQVQHGECKAFNRCSLVMKRRSVRQWTCGSCGGTSLGK